MILITDFNRGSLNTLGWGNFAIFDRNCRLSARAPPVVWYEIGPWLLWELTMSVPVTLSDPEKQDTRGQIFLADFRNYTRAV